MQFRTLIQTLAIALVAGFAVMGSAAAGLHPPVAATQLSPTSGIARQEDARRNDPRIYGTPTAGLYPSVAGPQLSPAQRIAIQEDARHNDPRIYGTSATASVAPAVVEIVAPGGFDWADAGVGAGAAFALLLLGLGVTMLVRNRPLSGA
jgi:hypothetical protein